MVVGESDELPEGGRRSPSGPPLDVPIPVIGAMQRDALWDCSGALAATLAIGPSMVIPPFAAAAGYTAVTGGVACITKLMLLASSASKQQYEQVSCGLNFLNLGGLPAGLAGITFGRDYCEWSSLGATAWDLVFDFGVISAGKAIDQGLSRYSLGAGDSASSPSYYGYLGGDSSNGSLDDIRISNTSNSGGGGGGDFRPRSGPGRQAYPL